MKVIAFNGSARKDGNTAALINLVFGELQKAGIETELFQLAGKKIRGCIACYKCFQNKDQRCSVTNDVLNECIEKMLEADGIILASPTYFANVSTELKALIDRAGLVAKANGDMFRRKVGAAVVAVCEGQAASTSLIPLTTSSLSTRWSSRVQAIGTWESAWKKATWKRTRKAFRP